MSSFETEQDRANRFLWDTNSGVMTVKEGEGEPLDLSIITDEQEAEHTPTSESDARAQANDSDGPAVDMRPMHGLLCVIESPKGSMRSGPGWQQRMVDDYGYIAGHDGADGDSLDCYIGQGPGNGWVYLVDQQHLDAPGFDETKVMINYPSMTDAHTAYLRGHHRSSDVFMDITPMPVTTFKQWLESRDVNKPAMDY